MSQFYLKITASESFWWCTDLKKYEEWHLCYCHSTPGVSLVDRARHVSRELCNPSWYHLIQQLDPSVSYKKKLAQYPLYGHHGRGDEETEKDIVRGSREEKKRVTEQETKKE